MEKFLYNNKVFRDRRRDLRRDQTEAEKVIWQHLRNRKLGGLKFVRQFSIGPYIIDFYCSEIRLAIELDGKIHEKQDAKIYDKERSGYLESLDIRIIRFKNEEVVKNTRSVLAQIAPLLV